MTKTCNHDSDAMDSIYECTACLAEIEQERDSLRADLAACRADAETTRAALAVAMKTADEMERAGNAKEEQLSHIGAAIIRLCDAGKVTARLGGLDVIAIDLLERLLADVERLTRERECYRETRVFWSLDLREAIKRHDIDAVRDERDRGDAVVEQWLKDSHALKAARTRIAKLMDSMEAAWGVIANVGHKQGNWEAQDPEWRGIAERWRDNHWHAALGIAATPTEPAASEHEPNCETREWPNHACDCALADEPAASGGTKP